MVRAIKGKSSSADGKWLGLTSASTLFTIGDGENTQLALHHGQEINPIYGSHPGRLRYYGIALPILGVTTYLSYRWKREDDALHDARYGGHPWYDKWYMPQAVNSLAHAVGILYTLAATGK